MLPTMTYKNGKTFLYVYLSFLFPFSLLEKRQTIAFCLNKLKNVKPRTIVIIFPSLYTFGLEIVTLKTYEVIYKGFIGYFLISSLNHNICTNFKALFELMKNALSFPFRKHLLISALSKNTLPCQNFMQTSSY